MEKIQPDHIELRAPSTVMRLSRLGSLHQCRLSFMRMLTRRMARESWRFTRTSFDIDGNGVGYAVYTAHGPAHSYSLIAFSHDLPPEMRSDRVIATAWDATFCLFDGVPTADDITRLERNVPLQEAGRVSQSEISVSRANRSVRLWEHFVNALASGQQPDPEQTAAVGYLMRTTAVYGSGKLGAADRETIAERPEMRAPFQAEMLSVYLTRWFVRDLVEHMARQQNPKAARLDPEIGRQLGIGNSTGLGMAPYLINHPVLFNNWIAARETAIARVCAVQIASNEETALFHCAYAGAKQLIKDWVSEHPVQQEKLSALRADLTATDGFLAQLDPHSLRPWNALMQWACTVLSEEGQELIASLMLEPYGALVDSLGDTMADDDVSSFCIDGRMHVTTLRALMEQTYGWALGLNWEDNENCARAWYVSEEKLEPRLGERFEEPIADFEQPLAPARDAAAAYSDLTKWKAKASIAEFLLSHPEHRHTVRRAQISAITPYSEIRDNTISASVMPIDMLRAKLSFFGVTHFDPRSDRWVRVCMYAGAPYPEDLDPENADFWVYPGCTA